MTTSQCGLPIKGPAGTSSVRMIINRWMRPGVASWQFLRKRLVEVSALRVENRQAGIRSESHRIKKRFRAEEPPIPDSVRVSVLLQLHHRQRGDKAGFGCGNPTQ